MSRVPMCSLVLKKVASASAQVLSFMEREEIPGIRCLRPRTSWSRLAVPLHVPTQPSAKTHFQMLSRIAYAKVPMCSFVLKKVASASAQVLSSMEREEIAGIRCLRPRMSWRRLVVPLHVPTQPSAKTHFQMLSRTAFARVPMSRV